MKYPAIVYGVDNIVNHHANDGVYFSTCKYVVTVIDKNPDSEIVSRVSQMRSCRFNRHYEKDNLNHDVFTLFF